MEMGKEKRKQTGKYRVILKQAPDPAKAAEVILQRAGGDEQHVNRLVNSLPVQIATDLDPLRAEDLAGALRAIGADTEKRLIPSSVTCSDHEGQPGRSVCLVCGEVVCQICMKEAKGQPLCLEHSGQDKPDIPIAFPWVRVILLLILIGVGAYGYYVLIIKERTPFTWDRPYRLAVVGFMVELPDEWRGFINKFRADTGREYIDMENHTLPDMVGWFQREYERYGGSMPQALELEIFGPFDEMEPPPEPPLSEQKIIDRFLQWFKFKDHFKKFDGRHKLELGEFDGVIYVQFVNGPFDGFLESWASKRENIALVNCYLSVDMIEQDIMIVLHEFFHLVNAKDHYDEDLNVKIPEGLPEPFADPLYPQRFADIMAGRIADDESMSREIMSLSEVRVNIYTAREVGWISDESFEQMITNHEIISLE